MFTASDKAAVEQGCYFDYASADRVRGFFRGFLRHSIGEKAGEPFDLMAWQWERIIAPAFGWMMPDGSRRFQEIEIWIPKKNGKSTLCAGIALYLLCGDGEHGSHVYGAASDRKQAGIVYREAASMCRKNPDMEQHLKIRDSHKTIKFPLTNSFYEVLSSDAYRNEGLNIHGLIFDELHAQPNRQLWSALKYGGASRRQPMRFVASTAGEHDEESLWWERFSYAKRVQSSQVVDIRVLACVYAIEDNEDWNDVEVHKRVNPGWGETINPESFASAYNDAKLTGTNESEFLRYRLNKPTKHESAWINSDYWKACIIPTNADVEYPKGGFRYGAVDLSDHLDLTAYAELAEVLVNGEPRLQLRTKFWVPTEPISQKNKERYAIWAEKGYVKCIPGPIASQETVEDDIVEYLLNNSTPPLQQIGVDRFNATRFVYSMKTKMRDVKITSKLMLISYNAPTLNDAMKELEELILTGMLVHDNSPVMRFMFNNCMASMDSSGNRKLDKAKSNGKIDGFAALLMTVYLCINKEAAFKTKYTNQRLLVVQS